MQFDDCNFFYFFFLPVRRSVGKTEETRGFLEAWVVVGTSYKCFGKAIVHNSPHAVLI
jgi:hypothetical protein